MNPIKKAMLKRYLTVVAGISARCAATNRGTTTTVIPAQAGIHEARLNRLDSGLRRNDGLFITSLPREKLA